MPEATARLGPQVSRLHMPAVTSSTRSLASCFVGKPDADKEQDGAEARDSPSRPRELIPEPVDMTTSTTPVQSIRR